MEIGYVFCVHGILLTFQYAHSKPFALVLAFVLLNFFLVAGFVFYLLLLFLIAHRFSNLLLFFTVRLFGP